MTGRHRPRTGWDVVIVGARVAGASTALLLARAGVRVLVVDRARRGSDTLSTHALMRGGVLQLRRWGLLDRVIATGTPPIRRVTFHYGTELEPTAVDRCCRID
jgi:2-polyprenyl-6-methoxyphenol hydroxylase-like FAD-dependent oxidoreductase